MRSLLSNANNQNRSLNKRRSLLMAGASIATIGALSMTAPTLASAKTIQPSTADYSFTVEDKYKGTATRTLSKSGSTYKLLGIGRTHNLSFNSAAKKVTSTYKGKTTTSTMAQQAFDDLSLEAQIRQDLLNGKFSGNYYMAKKDKIEKTPFKRSGNTKITVPAGTFETVRVDRIHDDNSRSTSFWLAPSLDYLPVKVSQINDGKKMDLELSKVR